MELTSKIVTLCFPARCMGCDLELPPYEHATDSVVVGPSLLNQPPEQNDGSRGFGFESMFGFHWCPDCWRQLSVRSPQQCRKCGANLFHPNPLPDACSLCHGIDLRFERALATGNYRGLLQELVIRMKNQHDEQIAIQLGVLLAFHLTKAEFFPDVNLVVPVPAHWWRRIRRGFLASEVIAETVANACNFRYTGQIMRCCRETKKQGTLSTHARFKNVRGAFEIRSHASVEGKNILLVDDVMTSGATASEMARILLRQGAAKVYVGVIARGARVS